MTHLIDMVNQLFAGAVPVADFLWDFPTNFDWYANIPILGNFSVAILLLLGGSLFFTIRFGFVQVKEFKTSIKMLTQKRETTVGTSQLAAFLISMGGRVGAGNIVGVTGAVTIGGPGAIFWMWISAFMGMATAFGEATLRCAIEAGLTVKIKAPTPEAPSMVKAIDIYVDQVHAGKEVEMVQIVEDRQKEEFIRSQQHKLAKKSRSRRTAAPSAKK